MVICERPFSWMELCDIIHRNELHRLGRSPIDEEKYQHFRKQIQTTWCDPIDYVLHSKFHFEKKRRKIPTDIVMPEGKDETNDNDANLLWEVTPKLHQVTEVQIELCLNDYPYYFEEGIEHYVLWKLREPITDEDITNAKHKIILSAREKNNQHGHGHSSDNNNNHSDEHDVSKYTSTIERNGNEKIIDHWVNPLHLQSLPDIDHAHIVFYNPPPL